MGDTRSTLTKTEWVGNRTYEALHLHMKRVKRKVLFCYYLYEREGDTPIMVTYQDLLDMGVITRDIRNCSQHYKTKKRFLPNPG